MKVNTYYPGCTAESTSKEYEVSTRAVCETLNIYMKEIDDFNCCGATPAQAVSEELSAALCARNLRLAADMNADSILTPCPSCLAGLKAAKYKMDNNKEFKEEIDALLDTPTTQLPDTYSVLQYISENVDPQTIRQKVKKSLKGLKVACYYGCLITRPEKLMQFDGGENPMSMDNLMTALGAECVPYPLKTECCGAAKGIPEEKMTSVLTARLLKRAKEFGAQAIVVACPLCQMTLDLRQRQAEKQSKETYDIPVFYFTQLMAAAFGLPKHDILLEKLVVNPQRVMRIIDNNSKQEVA